MSNEKTIEKLKRLGLMDATLKDVVDEIDSLRKVRIRLDNAIEAIETIQEFNPMKNDLHAYLYDVAEWGLGEINIMPKKEDYGL